MEIKETTALSYLEFEVVVVVVVFVVVVVVVVIFSVPKTNNRF